MRIARTWIAGVVVCCAVGALAADDPPLPQRAWPGGDRAALEVPADVWDRVLAGTVPGRRPLGYTGDEMRNYGGREHLLRTVENLFRDVRSIPRDTGRITDDLLALARDGKVDEVVQRCWALTDMPAGRMFPAVPRDAWGVTWAPKDATPGEVLTALWLKAGWKPQVMTSRGAVGRTREVIPYEDAGPGDLAKLPAPVQRLVARLAVGAAESHRWFSPDSNAPALVVAMTAWMDSTPDASLAKALGRKRDAWRRIWTDEEYDQSASRAHDAFDELAKLDASRLAYATAIWAAHLRTAIDECRDAAVPAADLPEGSFTVTTALGPVVVSGSGDDEVVSSAIPPGTWCVIDLGGNDRWKGSFGSPNVTSYGLVSVALDLGGDDTWDAGDADFALGCGAGGIGAVIDLSGNDTYTVKSDGLGRGLFGTGLLWDLAGNDTYVVKTKWGQGAAHAGVGVLLDAAGDDTYECAEQSQGMGSTLGCGLLLDLAGNDAYVCRDDGNVSALYLNQSVAMAQGCGYGRRADIGDGRSLAGGWGLLVDGAGNDRYHAQCWSQGCGYWWGVGVLEDRGGDDVYENGKYSLGAGAHFAIGVQVDLAGDDRYNVGVATTKNQFQGHARDGSIGVSIDGDGNDRYALKNMCAGCADLASVALFWDRRGDDIYEAVMEKDLGDTGPFGTATTYPPSRSFRDDLPAVGVFLDTGGKDTYSGDPRSASGVRDGGAWTEQRGPASRGWGLDADLFAPR